MHWLLLDVDGAYVCRWRHERVDDGGVECVYCVGTHFTAGALGVSDPRGVVNPCRVLCVVNLANWAARSCVLCGFCFVISLCAPNFASSAETADLVIVDKTAKTLSLHRAGTAIATFNIAFGGDPIGHKQQEGDQKTPEGDYVLDYKKADSAFYKAIHISYPNEQDKARAEALGVSLLPMKKWKQYGR